LAALPPKAGEFLHADFAIRRHHGADRLAVDLGHQRLEHTGRLDAERFGRLQPDALGVGIVVVSVQGEFHAQSFQRLGCTGGFGHCRSVVDKC